MTRLRTPEGIERARLWDALAAWVRCCSAIDGDTDPFAADEAHGRHDFFVRLDILPVPQGPGWPCPRCKGHHGYPAQEPHGCPYAMDIHNDHRTLCTCCAECELYCAVDI